MDARTRSRKVIKTKIHICATRVILLDGCCFLLHTHLTIQSCTSGRTRDAQCHGTNVGRLIPMAEVLAQSTAPQAPSCRWLSGRHATVVPPSAPGAPGAPGSGLPVAARAAVRVGGRWKFQSVHAAGKNKVCKRVAEAYFFLLLYIYSEAYIVTVAL